MFSITSFNEWGEGTQIEPAISFRSGKRSAKAPYASQSLRAVASISNTNSITATPATAAHSDPVSTEPVQYESYGIGGPDLYMTLTAKFSSKYRQAKRAESAEIPPQRELSHEL
jgi:hypothetical protein